MFVSGGGGGFATGRERGGGRGVLLTPVHTLSLLSPSFSKEETFSLFFFSFCSKKTNSKKIIAEAIENQTERQAGRQTGKTLVSIPFNSPRNLRGATKQREKRRRFDYKYIDCLSVPRHRISILCIFSVFFLLKEMEQQMHRGSVHHPSSLRPPPTRPPFVSLQRSRQRGIRETKIEGGENGSEVWRGEEGGGIVKG